MLNDSLTRLLNLCNFTPNCARVQFFITEASPVIAIHTDHLWNENVIHSEDVVLLPSTLMPR